MYLKQFWFMKSKVKILLLLMATLVVVNVHAQEKKLGLKEAIDLSIKNSKQLKIKSAQIKEATASVTEASQRRLPDAKVSGAYMRLNPVNVDMKKQNPGTTPAASPKISQALYGIVNLSLPIYTGGKIRYGIESSQFLEKAIELDAENERGQVIENTVEAYVNLFKARAAVDLLNRSLVDARQRAKDFQNLEKNGLLARNDLMKAELQVSNLELQLLDLENNWQLANINMNLMLGLPDSTTLIADSSMINQNFAVSTLDDYLQQAAHNRKDIEAIDLRKQAAQAGVRIAKSDYLPNLAVTGGYIALDLPGFILVPNALNLGIGVNYSISSLWKTKAKVQGAEARAEQLAITQDLINDQVRLQVNRAYLNWLSGQKKIQVHAQAIEQANEGYRVVKNKYNNSLATATELLDADLAQLEANLNYVNAKADAVVAYNQLLLAAGELENANK
jgi:outer membrane protein